MKLTRKVIPFSNKISNKSAIQPIKPNKFNKTYKKYKRELDLLDKYVDNPIIYDIIYRWGTAYHQRFYPLHSQINIYEGIFISEVIKAYVKKSMKNLSILEIGCAYGTSAMFMLNMLNKYEDKKILYKIIDPFQDTQWNMIGIYNANRIRKRHIKINWLKGMSDDAMEELTKEKNK